MISAYIHLRAISAKELVSAVKEGRQVRWGDYSFDRNMVKRELVPMSGADWIPSAEFLEAVAGYSEALREYLDANDGVLPGFDVPQVDLQSRDGSWLKKKEGDVDKSYCQCYADSL